MNTVNKTMAFQGEPGANSHIAIREAYPITTAAVPDVRGCLNAIASGDAGSA
jgi:hypothetical protein